MERCAGAVVYTKINDEIRYLLIHDNHGNYGFPKGHLENNESDEEAAIREIKEETNIDIRLDVDFRKEVYYVMPNGMDKTVVYFLGYFENDNLKPQEGEVDLIELFPYEEAMNMLTFDNIRPILSEANEYLTK